MRQPFNHLAVAGFMTETGPAVSAANFVVSAQFDGKFKIDPDGKMYQSVEGGAYALVGTWLTSGLASDVEVSATRTGNGTLQGNTLSTQFNCGTVHAWGITTASFARNSIFTLTFRDKNTLAELDTVNIEVDLSGTS